MEASSKTVTPTIPNIVWAQRTDRIFITIQLPDAKDLNVTYDEEGHFSFSCTTPKDGKKYEVKLNLYGPIDVEGSKHTATSRAVEVNLVRKEEGDYWPRLIKEGGKPHYIKVDWDKWRDEDDEGEG